MVQGSVLDAVVELVNCKCNKGCKTNVCSCRMTGLVFADACVCSKGQYCKNHKQYDYKSSDDEK